MIFLLIAAGAYFGFAVAGQPSVGVRGTITSPAGGRWLLIEVLHCLAFGTAALAGWRGSAWWLAAGWALHPVWDVVVHYYGPGRSFTPWTYAIACVSFDLVVALYVAVAYGAGRLDRPRTAIG